MVCHQIPERREGMMDFILDINLLLKKSVSERQKLIGLYIRLPATECRRQTSCCMMLPEMTLIEALVALEHLKKMAPSRQVQILKKLVKYFFLNPVEITACPFLEAQACLIYTDRFFVCRAYGLWSRATYDELSTQTQMSKQHLHNQWANLGVTLPESVTGFQVPYCPYVKITDTAEISDRQLNEIAENIDLISQQLGWEVNLFRQHYFLDLSFLIASWIYGYTKAVQLKFAFVKNYLSSGNRAKRYKMISDIKSESFSSLINKGEPYGMQNRKKP